MSGALLDFIRDSGSVRWYRGMSRVQTGACDNLLHALRDDTEQGSTYRVRRCLSQLGLHPLVRSAQISAIMGISQGSDLAFLWFLWEDAYKQPHGKHEESDPTPYTVNEQLLLSGIAHLDMPSTLRALDTLLPPACQFKKPSPKKKSAVKVRQPKQMNQDVLPYFLTQVRPRLFTPRGRYRPPEMKLQFPEYSGYANRMHEIPNEQSRWFADYQLSPEKRVIKNLINEELKRLVEPRRSEEPRQLCETHRIIEEIESIQRQEKAYEVYRRCLSQLDVPGSELKARRKRIVAELERQIECAADKIRGESRRLLNQVKSIRNVGGADSCQLCHVMVSSPGQVPRGKADLSMLMGPGDEDKPIAHLVDHETPDDPVQVMVLQSNEPNRCGAGDCRFTKGTEEPKKVVEEIKDEDQLQVDSARETKDSKPLKKGTKSKKPKEVILEEPPEIRIPHFQKLADLIPACSRTLPCLKGKKTLRCSQGKSLTNRSVKGIELDFFKIFDLPGIPENHLDLENPHYVEDKQAVIEKLCIEALNEGQYQPTGKEFRQDEFLAPVLKAAATCAVDMFRSKMGEEHEAIAPEQDESKKKNELIDPNNRQQIEDILKAALQVLRSNPHFVLATFPNAHKLPILLDWVADRYGKTFTQEEMNALVKSTFGIYDRIYKVDPKHNRQVLRLRRGLTDLEGNVNYRNFKSFQCVADQRKAKYHSKLNEQALEQARLTWMALRGYSRLGGQIKDTFFAYMPARESDLKRQHMWKSNDFRNAYMNRLKSQKRRSA